MPSLEFLFAALMNDAVCPPAGVAGAFSVSTLVTAGYLPRAAEAARWTGAAQRVTILRDTWGIAHLVGKTDADCSG